MKLPHALIVVFAVVVSVLTGCATNSRSAFAAVRHEPALINNGSDALQRQQAQMYEAATGPNHVGSTYKP